jgi:hypothetical protein
MPQWVEPPLAEWDATIARAQHGAHVEEKLIHTVRLLTAAIQRSRLRGDTPQLNELSTRLHTVHDLLDQV